MSCSAAVQTAMSNWGVLDKIAAWRRARAEAERLGSQLLRATEDVPLLDRLNFFAESDPVREYRRLRRAAVAQDRAVLHAREEAREAVERLETVFAPMAVWRRVADLTLEAQRILVWDGPQGSGMAALGVRARDVAELLRTTWLRKAKSDDPLAAALMAGQASLASRVDLRPAPHNSLHWQPLDGREFAALLRDGLVPPDAPAPWFPELDMVRRRCPPLGLYLDAVGVEAVVAEVQEGSWAFDQTGAAVRHAARGRAAVAYAVSRLRRNFALAFRAMPLPDLRLDGERLVRAPMPDELTALVAGLNRVDMGARLDAYVDFAIVGHGAGAAARTMEATVATLVRTDAEQDELDRVRRVGGRVRRTLGARWDETLERTEAVADTVPNLVLANRASEAYLRISAMEPRPQYVIDRRDAALAAVEELLGTFRRDFGLEGTVQQIMAEATRALESEPVTEGAARRPIDAVADELRATEFAAMQASVQALTQSVRARAAHVADVEKLVSSLDRINVFESTPEGRALDAAVAGLHAEQRSLQDMSQRARATFDQGCARVPSVWGYLGLVVVQEQLRQVEIAAEWRIDAPGQVHGVLKARQRADAWYADLLTGLGAPCQAEQCLTAWAWSGI